MSKETKQRQGRFLNYDKPFATIDEETEIKSKIKTLIISSCQLIKAADYDKLVTASILDIASHKIYKLLRNNYEHLR